MVWVGNQVKSIEQSKAAGSRMDGTTSLFILLEFRLDVYP